MHQARNQNRPSEVGRQRKIDCVCKSQTSWPHPRTSTIAGTVARTRASGAKGLMVSGLPNHFFQRMLLSWVEIDS
jgi:hypothetical protein